MVYIRQRDLPRLREYKYSGVDKSFLSRYVLKPFYTNVAIRCFPMSMAPSLDQDCPPWVYLSWSIGLFLYQTFDAVDGTQARRTHQSGPLGELFDHGVDAINTFLEVLLFASAMNLGQSWQTVLTLFGSLFTFYIQTWDEYHTKTLTLGYVSGPVEGICTLWTVYFITFLVGGGSFWQQPMLPFLGFPKAQFLSDSLYDMAFSGWWMGFGGIVLLYNTWSSATSAMKARSARGEPPYAALKGLLPAAVMWTIVIAYLWLQPIILYHHLVPFVFFIGLVNAYSVGQMITAHLVKAPFPYQNVLLAPLAFGVFDSLGPHLGLWPSLLGDGAYQVAFMFFCLGAAFAVYGSFVHDVITTICDYMDIWCLTIKHPHVEGKENGGVAKKQQ
ncbi:MAG: hypothetical protein Q9227_001178 [Pyrenula ochraceoflavens]